MTTEFGTHTIADSYHQVNSRTRFRIEITFWGYLGTLNYPAMLTKASGADF